MSSAGSITIWIATPLQVMREHGETVAPVPTWGSEWRNKRLFFHPAQGKQANAQVLAGFSGREKCFLWLYDN